MGYLNQAVGYRQSLLHTRSVIKPGKYALLELDGLVKNQIPGFENCDVTILASPKLGASFVDYLVTVYPDGKNHTDFGADGVEAVFYVLEGSLLVKIGKDSHFLDHGGFVYSPPGARLFFENPSSEIAKVFIHKRRYISVEGFSPYIVSSNAEAMGWSEYEGMADVLVKELLPKDLAFDCNIHLIRFQPGASHGYVETHVQEHGAYCLSGQAMYNLDNDWIPVQKGDYIFMHAYCPQACYAVGRGEAFTYLYSKDCNRDVLL
jgi:(S)-ureidoglycine aminohydrolase